MGVSRLVIVFLCLLAVGVGAETNPQLDSIRVAAYNQIGVPVAGSDRVTDAITNAIINYGIQRVSTDFPAVEKLDTITMDTVSEGSALASDFVAISWCQLMIDATQRIALEFRLPDSLFEKRPSDSSSRSSSDDRTTPRYYYTHARQLMVYPKFVVGDIGDTALFLVSYYAVGDALTAESDSTNIHSEYRDELLNWVCYRLEKLRYRYASAATYKTDYDSEVKRTGFKK